MYGIKSFVIVISYNDVVLFNTEAEIPARDAQRPIAMVFVSPVGGVSN